MVWPPVKGCSGKPSGRLFGHLSLAAGIVHAALQPDHVLGADAIFVRQKAARPNRRGDLVFGDADFLAFEVLGSRDAAVGANVDARAAEGARQKHRYPDIGADAAQPLAARGADDIARQADLGDVEILVIPGAMKTFLGRYLDEIDIAALDLDASVHDRAHAVVIPGRDGDFELAPCQFVLAAMGAPNSRCERRRLRPRTARATLRDHVPPCRDTI